MRGSTRACLLILGVSVAPGLSCSKERPRPAVDLLARRPEDPQSAAGTIGVHVDLEERRVRLDPGAEVRYRIAPRVAGQVRLKARATGEGAFEVDWFAIDLAKGTETPRGEFRIEGVWPGEVEKVSELPDGESLVELRLAWHASPGAGQLELSELALHESAPVERTPIILIVIDTLSASHLSTYGYPLVTDPGLAHLAAESFVFERCFSNATWTLPSFMALMSGIYARAHELQPPAGPEMWQQWYLSQNRWTLAESLRTAGHRTAGFVDSAWLTGRFGLTQGFDVYDSSAAEGAFGPHERRDGGIRRTTALAQAFLEDLGPAEPFLLFLHALDVHGAYLAKPTTWPYTPDSEPYDRERTRPAGGSPQAFGIIPTYIARGEVPSGELPSRMPTASIEQAYDEGIRYLDEELGKFLAFLRQAGILERSWLVFTADHGETMSDAALLFGHGVLDQDVTRVPLLIRPPGECPSGRRVPEAVQLVDLYPTLVELAGLECRPPHHGRSLVPLLRNEEREPGPVLVETGNTRQAMLIADGWMLVEREPTKDLTEHVGMISHPLLMRNLPTLAELESRAREGGRGLLSWLDDVELKRDFFERLPESGPTESLMAQMKTRKEYEAFLRFVRYVLKGPFYELYDMAADPEAEHDVAAQHPEKLDALKKLLKQEQLRRTQAWRNATAPAEPVVLPPEDIQALEALGYGGGEDDDGDDHGD